MPSPKRGESRAVAVTASLRRDILAGRLEPGRRLPFPELCATYTVSVGVLREALVRLVDHGIVRAESNLGFSVMSLSEEDLLDLTDVRAQIEPGFVRAAVEVGTMQWEGDVLAAHHLMERTPMRLDQALSDDWVTAHAEFHSVLVSGAGNRRMMEITRRLRDEADLYRRWYLSDAEIERHGGQIADEHRELLDATLARDAGLAEALLHGQIERATERWTGHQSISEAGVTDLDSNIS
jgi:DNA-binding GntR family transcriptional regulator